MCITSHSISHRVISLSRSELLRLYLFTFFLMRVSVFLASATLVHNSFVARSPCPVVAYSAFQQSAYSGCGGSAFRGSQQLVASQPVAPIADVVGYTRRVSLNPPPVNMPEDAKECYEKLQYQCQSESEWNKQEGWEMLKTASQESAMSGVCGSSLSFEAWNFCKCGWLMSPVAASRPAMAELRVREPKQLQVRLDLSSEGGSIREQAMRGAIQAAVVALEQSSGMVKTGIENQRTKQTMDVGTSDKMSIIVHTYDTTRIDITWYLQNTVSFGAALSQLNDLIIGLRNGIQTEVKEILVDMKPTTLKRQMCGE